MSCSSDPVRLLIVPGLNDSGPAHWQTWLERQHGKRAVRVRQHDWAQPDLQRWADRIHETLAPHPHTLWVAAAHSFGSLALVRFLAQGGRGVHGALLVAPADPDKFGIAAALPQQRLAVPTTLIASESDPWMHIESAGTWARAWGSQFVNLGDAGHINADAGFGPLPQIKSRIQALMQRVERQRRLDRARLPEPSVVA